jgi:hypothetical protein
LNRYQSSSRTQFRSPGDYLEGTGELGEPQVASSVLLTSVESMVRLGERRLMLSNRAIMDYKKYRAERNGLEVVA